MKSKKIILSMVSMLIFMVGFLCQTVFAYDYNETGWIYTSITKDNNVNTENILFKVVRVDPVAKPDAYLTQIGAAENATDFSGVRELNKYCALANVGFEARTPDETNMNNLQDTYHYKYQMSMTSNDKEAIQELYSQETYKKILALADLFYLGTTDIDYENYLRDLWNKQVICDTDVGTGNIDINENPITFDVAFKTYEDEQDKGIFITEQQIRAVQQAALWHYTNGFNYGFENTINDNEFLSYYSSDEYVALAGNGGEGTLQDKQAKILYRYLITTTDANSNNENYTFHNTVNLYTKNTIHNEVTASEENQSQPILEIIPGEKKFDLALRKYITAVGDTEITDRIPEVYTQETLEDLNSGKTTAEYKHKKDPVQVSTGDTVTYTITIYNEGDIAGKATEIIDQLPSGVSFNATETEAKNTKYNFEVLEGNKLKITAKNTLGSLQPYTAGEPDNTSVYVVCNVVETPDAEKEKILTNIAWISKAYNASENIEFEEVGFDRDSAPGDYPKKGEYDYTADDLKTIDEVGYTGKEEITTKEDLANSDKHYEGIEDDDDFEKIIIKPEQMDLALRKFITKIGNENITDREPTITGNKVETTTAEKTHPKNKLGVAIGQKVIYTIRVYNEGKVNGYATEVTDYLPDGLTLVSKENSTINTTYGWEADNNNNQIIRTSYLADKLITGVNGDFTKFNENDAANKYYRDLQVECIVNENATSDNLKNIAAITDEIDENGNKKDADSNPEEIADRDNYNPQKPEEGLGEQDDDDFEDLRIQEFDLALRKYITKVENENGEVVKSADDLKGRNPNKENKIDLSTLNVNSTTAEYKHQKDPVKVSTGDRVTYTITIYNEGDIAGKATEIIDQLPTGVKFNAVETGKLTENTNYTFNELDGNKVKIKAKDSLDNLNPYKNAIIEENGQLLDNTSVKVVCDVIETPDTEKEIILTNIAWISEAYNAKTETLYKGNVIGFDRDSAPGDYPKNGNADYVANELRTEDSIGYTGKETIKTKEELSNSDKYYKGFQDEDDFEKIIIEPKKFDLALRKFITKIGDKNITDRIPQVTEDGKSFENEETTAIKEHKKDKLGVTVGQKVVYTIRVYNEGYRDGYATQVTDYLPEGLTLVSKENSTINTTYGWEADQKNSQTIRTSYLDGKILKAVNGDFTKFNETDAANKYYRDLQVECIVNEKATSKNLKNVAAVTGAKDEYGDEVKDQDSEPEEVDRDKYNPQNPEDGLGEQDDDDFEDLKIQEFDLALRKYIVKVENKKGEVVKSNEDLTGRNPNEDNKIDLSTIEGNLTTATYKHRKDPVLVNTGYTVYYNLTVYNEGDIDGYAKTITDKLPAGTEFIEIVDAESSKYEVASNENGILVLKRKDAYKDTKLKAYEEGNKQLDNDTVTIKCKVVADNDEDKDKIYTNIAWISEDFNEYGATDRDSKPENHPEEDKLITNYDDNGYIGNKENKDKDLSDENEYFRGEQDDDDFEKIIIYKEPEVHKGVKDVKNQDSGYDGDVEQEWVVNSTLPLNIKDYKKYEMVDDIDKRLVYGKVTEVNIISKEGKKLVELEENKDYILEYKENNSNEKSEILGLEYSGTLRLTFIDANKQVSDKLKENAGNIIEVKFTTTFATDENGNILAEIIGKEIPNTMKLEYENATGDEGEKESERPEVHTGGITLYKYTNKNGKKVALKDAEFEIFRNKEDAKTRANEVKAGTEKSSVKAVQKASSGKNGLVEFVGLEYGEDAINSDNNLKADGTYIQGTFSKRDIPSTKYWIVETKAPNGYKTNAGPIEVTINNDTYKEDVEVLIKEEESKETTNRLVENEPLNFDLALRKFITKVDDKKITTRVPEIKYEDGKISYEHTKDPVNVVNGNVVTYTLRIFNEGQINGYASVITDDIPDGLEFLPEHKTNKKYRWIMYEELKDGTEIEDESKVVECKVKENGEVKKYVETTDSKKAVIIRTDYLSMEQGKERMKESDTENPNLLKAFNPDEKISETNPDNKDVEVAFRVIEPNGSKRTLINYAQISDDTDENGDEIDDKDSIPDEWNDKEDDQDIEKVRVPEFDLALRKWVTQAIVIEDGKETVTETGHDAWDEPEDIVKVELHRKKLSNVTVKFKYSIRVYNQGELDGYAKEITDYVPEGLKFVAEDNPGWKDEGNNVISTRLLENTLLKAKEGYADVEVVLTWINGNDNLGLKTNIAEISEDYNEEGVPDKDSKPDNKKPGEDDIDDAPVMLSVSTGIEVQHIILGTSILAIIAGGIFLIKKYVL